MQATVSIVLDRRRALQTGGYPVKLMVTFRVLKGKWIQKYYGLGAALSEKDFGKVMGKSRVEEYQELLKRFNKALRRAQGILDKHEVMSPDLFDRLYSGSSTDTVVSLFDAYIEELTKYGQVGTASIYRTVRNTLTAYAGEHLSFMEVGQTWLKGFEHWMRSHKVKKKIKGKIQEVEVSASVTTISIALRCLRKIYNDAVARKLISADYYPFGRRQFVIQSVVKPKHALSEKEKNAVLAYQGEHQQAVDFWIFSYFSNGMNFTDIARLRYSDIRDEMIYLDRTKTIRTNRVLKKIEIPLRDETSAIIRKYGVKSLDPGAYVFGVLEPGLTPLQEKNRIHDFIDRTNAGLRAVAVSLSFKFRFTTYTARHTFATISVQKGASLEEVQIALGQSSLQTAQNYFAGFDRETKKGMSERL
jgi:integrase/recombinase XerD